MNLDRHRIEMTGGMIDMIPETLDHIGTDPLKDIKMITHDVDLLHHHIVVDARLLHIAVEIIDDPLHSDLILHTLAHPKNDLP
jgi:hypothetical protein